MDSKLLDILCCPVTLKPLGKLPEERLAQLNAAIAKGQVHNRGGDVLSDAFSAALITNDDRLVYPVSDGVPVLLEEAAIDLAALQDAQI